MNAHMKRMGALAIAGLAWTAGAAHDSYAVVKPQKLFAISSVNFRSPDGRTPKNTINFFDVSDIGPGGPTSGVFNNSPLFSIFIGLDYFQSFGPQGQPTGTEEDISTFTVNPANGTIYAVSFNQNTDPLDLLHSPVLHGESRATNDTAGDFDLWRIDYQGILKDYVTNSRPRGTIYAPQFAPTTAAIEQALADTADPRYDGTADGRFFGLNHEETSTFPTLPGPPPVVDLNDPLTVRLSNSILKIGEVGRPATEKTGGISFFNHQIEFINPETLLRLDAPTGNNAAGDHQIRVLKRVSLTPGAAVADLDGPDNLLGANNNDPNGDDDYQGGYNRGTVESWESKIIGRLQMDTESSNRSDEPEWAMIKRGNTVGVWVVEQDRSTTPLDTLNSGDDLSFFEINFSTPTPTVTKKDLFTSGVGPRPTFLEIMEEPGGTTNPVPNEDGDGEIDNIFTDAAGNVIFIESELEDFPGTIEPRVFSVGISSYDAADSDGDGIREVLPAGPSGTGFDQSTAWTPSKYLPVNGAIDDDTGATDVRFVAYDRGTGYLYIVDTDSTPANSEDVYVFDPATGSIVYHEFQPFDPGILNKATLKILLRGDINDDGLVNGTDIDAMFDAIADPTLGATVTAALGKEWYDLTGDGDLTTADATELIQGILKTRPGDQDLDGDVDGADLTVIKGGYATGSGWATGDVDGDGDVDGSDFIVWQRNVGFDNGLITAVAEPTTGALAGLAMVAAALANRRRRV